ncbi:MAG: hypothetical protein K0R12_917 [Gammaproteobacteria bacterium]|jgi:hypothetical protein|nr:hypothetical protein [Gammaproteobacteria bacterium]
MNEHTATQSVYERGGADFCDAIIHDEIVLSALNALFEMHNLKVIAIDGAFSAAKSVNLTIFLQKHTGGIPDKPTIQSQLKQMGFEASDYVLVEARLIGEKADLFCLALTFQGKDSIELAKDKLPPLALLEGKMQKIVAHASGMLAKVRVMATGVAGLFSHKKPLHNDHDSTDPIHDSTHKGPRRS